MGRRRDDDDEPAPRADGGRRQLVILAFVGAVALTLIAGCGLSGFIYLKSKFFSPYDESDRALAYREADKFLYSLSYNIGTMTYDQTSTNFQSAMSPAQFEELNKKHPVLGKHSTTRVLTSHPLTGAKPNRKLVIDFELIEFELSWARSDPNKPPASPRTLALTITVAEQPRGEWKVDGLVVK